uniref:CNNM transmembrane domain-containing protein n=1 Tax=Biomphalaria glabrata TaxID=6526 RepID=A0A2C9K129_BIOGL
MSYQSYINNYINCTIISDEVIQCNGTTYDLHEKVLTYTDEWFWIYIGIYVGLVIFAGLMSGLTMGLLSLDSTTLATMINGGTPNERKHAKRIFPVVKRHHLLLVTLLLSNSAAVEAMPIFLDRISNPIIAIVISVTAVLIFGEVIPQAVCTRYGLAIGSYLSPLVYLLMGIFFIVSFPLSLLLDCCLGTEHGTFFRRAQLKALIEIHGEDSQAEGLGQREESLSHDEVAIIKGCLDMKNKTAKDAMLTIDKAFMISTNAKLNYETLSHMAQHCHSRVPVYENERSNIVALLLTKTLIKLSPDDALPVSDLVGDERYSRPALFIDSDMPLFDLLNLFQTGRSHLAIVRQKRRKLELDDDDDDDDKLLDHSDAAPLLIDIEESTDDVPEGTVIGMITLEDVIEELLQEEIEDEKDIMQEISQKLQFSLAKRKKSLINILHRSRSQPQPRTGASMLDTAVSSGHHNPELRHVSISLQEQLDRQMEALRQAHSKEQEEAQTTTPPPPHRSESRVRFS